ncbi:MAG TPA: hypothetical protein PLT25_02880, partial [Acidocella sp.]|nr:hypothetical protein [Acidocella sp.]
MPPGIAPAWLANIFTEPSCRLMMDEWCNAKAHSTLRGYAAASNSRIAATSPSTSAASKLIAVSC